MVLGSLEHLRLAEVDLAKVAPRRRAAYRLVARRERLVRVRARARARARVRVRVG